MTVMTGLVQGFKEKNHEFVGDCVVSTESLVGFPYYEEFVQRLERTDLVGAVSPVLKSYALSEVGGYEQGVEVMGVDPVRHSRATNFAQILHYRANEPARAFEPAYDPNALGCVRGVDLALGRNSSSEYLYNAQPEQTAVNLTCFPLNAKGALALAGTWPVRTQKFYHSDYAHSGIARVDGLLVYIPLEQAQLLCAAGALKRVTGIHIKFKPGTDLTRGCSRVAELWREFKQDKSDAPSAYLLDTVKVESWKQYRRAFIAPMEKEQVLLSLMFVLVGGTTVFIVFVVFYMLIAHKRRDIGVLKSMGTSNTGIMTLLSGFAFAVGTVGSAVGVCAGYLFLAKINGIEDWLFARFGFQLWDRTIYAIGDIPNEVDVKVVFVIVCSAIVACLIGAAIPSYLAARLRPVETLHVGQV
jgi:ABC-type lipoprotein release transport system permease subunit